MTEDEEHTPTVTGRISNSEPEMQYPRVVHKHSSLILPAAAIAALVAVDFSGLERRIMSFNHSDKSRRYNYEEPAPLPNPRADRRKANRVKKMQARKKHRREMSGSRE